MIMLLPTANRIMGDYSDGRSSDTYGACSYYVRCVPVSKRGSVLGCASVWFVVRMTASEKQVLTQGHMSKRETHGAPSTCSDLEFCNQIFRNQIFRK